MAELLHSGDAGEAEHCIDDTQVASMVAIMRERVMVLFVDAHTELFGLLDGSCLQSLRIVFALEPISEHEYTAPVVHVIGILLGGEWALVHTVRERATNFHHAIRVGENEVLDRAANFRLRRAQKRVLHADAVVFGLRVHVVQPQGLLVSNSALLQSFFAGASHGRCACLAPA